MAFDSLRLVVANGTSQGSDGYYDLRVQTVLGAKAEPNPGVPIDFIMDGQLFKVGIITNLNGWINYILAASLLGNPGSNHTMRAIVDGQTLSSNTVSLTILPDSVTPPPPPPDPCLSCGAGTHCQDGSCVADTVTPPVMSWTDRLKTLFPDSLKPYAIPIAMTVGAIFLKKVV